MANVNVVVGDMNVENFPKLDDLFRDIFFMRFRDTMYFKIMLLSVLLQVVYLVYCSAEVLVNSIYVDIQFSDFLIGVAYCLFKRRNVFLSALFSVSKLSTLLM